MANPKHLEIARQGKDTWNRWRKENPNEPADFSDTDFTLPENRDVSFEGFEFGEQTTFKDTTFGNNISFEGATFEDWPSFVDASFGDGANFTGAVFGSSAHFEGAVFESLANFEDATFSDWANFDGAWFGGWTNFEGTTFSNRTHFEGAVFEDDASFEGATFGYAASFNGAEFGDDTLFEGATFGYGASFEGATFGDEANFEGAAFGDEANFASATFGDKVNFEDTAFGDSANFAGAAFECGASFEGTAFGAKALFANTAFETGASFRSIPQDKVAMPHEQVDKGFPKETKAWLTELWKNSDPGGFFWIDFTAAEFRGKVTFEGRTVRERAIFAHVRFGEPPDFWTVEKLEHLDLTGARFGFRGSIAIPERLQIVFGDCASVPIFGWTTDTKVADDLRRLRKIASEIHATDAERDLFILERQAERGVLWKNWWTGGWRSRLLGWWRPMSATVLMFLYWTLSNCGRSLFWPLAWLGIANYGTSFLYSSLVPNATREQLWTLMLAGALPFGEVNKTALGKVAQNLFADGVIPPMVQALWPAAGSVDTILS